MRLRVVMSLLVLPVVVGCESAPHKAERLRTAAMLACLPPVDSATFDAIRDSTARTVPSDLGMIPPPRPTEAARLAESAARCDVATRDLNAFITGR